MIETKTALLELSEWMRKYKLMFEIIQGGMAIVDGNNDIIADKINRSHPEIIDYRCVKSYAERMKE